MHKISVDGDKWRKENGDTRDVWLSLSVYVDTHNGINKTCSHNCLAIFLTMIMRCIRVFYIRNFAWAVFFIVFSRC